MLSFEGKEYRVSAIVEDSPHNTDLPFDVLLSYISIKKERDEGGWGGIWSDEHCYLLVKQGTNLAEIEKRMPDFVKKYYGQNSDNSSYTLQPLSEIHFDDRYGNYNYNTISVQTLTALGVIGIFLIITACIAQPSGGAPAAAAIASRFTSARIARHSDVTITDPETARSGSVAAAVSLPITVAA